MILYFKLKKYFKVNNDLANDIISSISYKIGFGITYPIRFITDFFKGKETILFHKKLPQNDFSNRFEQKWISLINSANNSGAVFNNQFNFELEGNIDVFNNKFVTGWFRNKVDQNQRLQIKVLQHKKNIGEAVCDKYRFDLVTDNVGDAHYGFSLEFAQPLKNIDDKISIKVFSKETKDGELLERGELFYKENTFNLVQNTNEYSGSFDKIIDTYACGWAINNANDFKTVTVLLYRNDELINTGQANLYRNDLRVKIKQNHNKAFRLKIPLVELLKGKAIYKVCTVDKFELGRIEWDPNTSKHSINQKFNNLKTDLYLPYYNGVHKQQSVSINQTIAIHIHVFYVDVFEEICNYIKQFSFNYHLYISTPENNLTDINNCLEQHKILAKKIVKTPNRGRDVAPFIIEFGPDMLNYDVALHLHTKKTKQNASLGKIWLPHILNCLIKDEIYVNAVFDIFRYLPKVGVIAPQLLNELVPIYNWGKNYNNTINFLKDLKIVTAAINKNEVQFPAGTMFWFIPKALEKLLTLNINYQSFPKEPISGDGSLAHVIERSIYYIAKSSGFEYQTVSPVNPNLIHTDTKNVVISIIIPIYNAEKWLLHAIQSIFDQTQFLESFEVLLVDNNSTDNSKNIAKMFSAIYANVQYLFQPKKGAGNARNLGIKNAKGKYLLFLDADDLLDSRALQNLMDLAYDGTSDLITSPLIIFNEKRFNHPEPVQFTTSKISIDMNTIKKSNKKIDQEKLPFLEALFLDFGPCAKLFKKEFIINNEIYFPENLNYEDNYFIYKTYLTAAQISICDEPTYLYRKLANEKGTTQSTTFEETDLLDQFEIMLLLIELLNEKQNKALKNFGHKGIIQKLVWMFNGIKSLPNSNSIIFPKLAKVLANFSESEIEHSGEKYVSYLKAIKSKNYKNAISKYKKL